ncbi:MAG: aspartate aminotransferase family protein [Ignavibacteria bacterium]|nr:aspartate aminotransferase family protein [Ignavibacteria bacterium]
MDNTNLENIISSEENDFFHTYKRLPIIIERGEGCWLYTNSGRKILDMFGGLAVNVLGYNHHAMNKAIEEQIKKYIHISNLFYQEKQLELAELITQMSGYSKVFFCNSGTEAVEAAIKLSRKFFLGTGKRTLVSFSGSFHGRTMGALSLTARKKYRDQFEPLLPDVKHLEFNSVESLEKNIDENTAAVFIECIQGEGGVNPAKQEFIDSLLKLREKYGFLIAADEIQSGVGRTGKMHAFEHFGLKPDIVILAKGIGGGLPLGAILGNERVQDVFTFGEHGSTFGGNPVAAASGIVVYSELKNGLMNKAGEMGELIISKLESLKMKFPEKIKSIRGKGLMIGIELTKPGQTMVEMLMNKDVLVNCTNENVIRLLPPYIISEKELDFFCNKFEEAMAEF